MSYASSSSASASASSAASRVKPKAQLAVPTLPPKQPKELTSPQTTTSKPNNRLSGAFTCTGRTQLPHRHPHHDNTAPSSDTGATLLAPKPGNGTNDTGGL
eukprot:12547069-Ditylum_brightwellii.AAC.1